MMKKTLKRTLSLMLAFCMTLGLATTGALAETLPEPVEDAQVEQTAPACAELAGCTGEAHDEGCPLYAAPENAANDELDPPMEESTEVPSEDQTSLGTDVSDTPESNAVIAEPAVQQEAATPLQQASLAAPQAEPGETHIATYVGVTPEGLTGDFSTPYSTVKATGADGVEYTVEVVPENLVYFIDQIDYNDGTVSKPYEAVKTLMDNQLLNDTYDRQISSGSGWGLVSGLDGCVSNDSSLNDDEKDAGYKGRSGIYGQNENGASLVYELPLEAGRYTITTGHHEWWNEWWSGQGRTMELSLTTTAGTETYGSVPGQDPGRDYQVEYYFELTEAQTVKLSVTATNGRGPVICWLGVVRDGDIETPTVDVVASGNCGYKPETSVKWVLTEDGVMTISGQGAVRECVISGSSDNSPWAELKDQIKTIVVEDGVTEIGNRAFQDCVNVTEITLADSVNELGWYCFMGCTGLTEINIPSRDITTGAFSGCTSLAKVTLSGNTWRIQSAFSGCTSLASITLPDSIKYLDGAVFRGTGLTSVKIPAGITKLECTFSGCANLANVTLPTSLQTIGTETFQNCTSLKSIALPAGLKHCYGSAFEGSGLTSIEVPASVESISAEAFKDCKSLTTVTLNDGLKTIYADAFNGCTALESIVIPASVTEIRPRAFDNTNLKYAVVDGATLADLDDTGIWEPSKGKYLPASPAICYAVGTITELPVLDNHILAILNGGSIVDGQPALEGKVLDGWYTSADFTGEKVEALTEAGVYYAKWKEAPPVIKVVASGNCGSPTLANVRWVLTEDGVMTLRGSGSTKTYASPDSMRAWMQYKDQITSVIVEDGITGIGGWMFNNCDKIESVRLPEAVTSLGNHAFGGCSLLESIEIPNVKYLDDNAFYGCSSLKTIGARSLRTIGAGAFSGCASLQETYLTDQVTKIGPVAYYGCASLQSAVIPNGIKEVGQSTFEGCSSLTEVIIPDSVVRIGSDTFKDCAALTQVTLPVNLTDLYGGTFEGCSSLTSIEIPSKVEDICAKAFMGCTSLQSVVIHAPIGTIYADAFNGCTALESIVIPASVTEIRPRAFDNTNLKYAVVDGATLADLDDTGNWEPSKGKYLPASPAICYAVGTITELPVLDNHILAILNGGSIVDGQPALEGKVLDGWYTSADFTGEKVEALTEAGVYYAKWVCEHTWGEGEVTQEATCTTAGVRTYTCTICSETKTEEIAAKGHTLTTMAKVPATCTVAGTIAHDHCSICNKDFVDGKESADLTIAQDPDNHVGETEVRDAKTATCKEDGYTGDTYCKACNNMVEQGKPIEKLAHTLAEAVREKEVAATCTTEGSYDEVVKCSACGEEISRDTKTIERLPHQEAVIPGKDATCTEPGLTEGKRCSVCNTVIVVQAEVPAKGHALTHVEAKAATTEAEGNIEYWHCTACDKYFRDAQATQEITLADTVVDRLTPSVPSGPSTPSVTTYRLTINYVFEDGTQAANTIRRSLSSGSSYSVPSPTVEGYIPDQAVVEGHLSGNLTVTVTYTKEQDVQEPDTPLTGAPVDTVFADVAKDAWYTAAIQHVYDKGLMSGISSASFAPNDYTTRGMIVTVLYRIENEPDAEKSSFTDVADGKYYFDAVNWASSQGVVTGYGNNLFGPEDQITREQMVAVLYRYAAKKGYDVTARADLSVFTDADQISAYAKEAMSWANAMGLVVGTSETTLSPTDKVTRAQIAMILMRFEDTFEKAAVA